MAAVLGNILPPHVIKWLSLIAIAAALVWGTADARDVGRAGRSGGATGGPAPDGAFIEGSGATFAPVTGSSTSLLTNYGVFSLGPYRSDLVPHWCDPIQPVPNGCSQFYGLYLNGHRINPYVQRFVVGFGGVSFFCEEDENCWQWSSYEQLPNGGIYPTPSGTPDAYVPGPPTWAPPYTPSTDGSAISGFTGTLTTLDGIWSWGNVQSGGYEVRLNGNTVLWNPPHLVATQMQVNSHGQMFVQLPDTTWRVILDYALRPANVPTGQAIPTVLNITPGAGSPSCGDLIFRMPNASTVGTTVATLAVTMSSGPAFSGTASVGLSNNSETLYDATVNLDGTITLKTHQSPVTAFPSSANNAAITVTQNGTSVQVSTTLAADTGC